MRKIKNKRNLIIFSTFLIFFISIYLLSKEYCFTGFSSIKEGDCILGRWQEWPERWGDIPKVCCPIGLQCDL